jgi:hypothetical protein
MCTVVMGGETRTQPDTPRHWRNVIGSAPAPRDKLSSLPEAQHDLEATRTSLLPIDILLATSPYCLLHSLPILCS